MNSEPAYVRLEGLSKRFGSHAAVEALSLEVPRGDMLALLGPSGSGKTTTLRLLAGFETPDAGRIVVDGEDVTSTPPAARRFGMVFQHYALFPHLDGGRNVAFGRSWSGQRGSFLLRTSYGICRSPVAPSWPASVSWIRRSKMPPPRWARGGSGCSAG